MNANIKRRYTIQTLGVLVFAVVFPYRVRAETPVIAGVAGPAVSLVYAYLTQDMDLWRGHGLDVRMILFESGSILSQVARSGGVQFAINSGPTTIASRTQGADSIIIAAVVNTLPYSVVAVKGITTWNQLKGKKVGISRIGSGTDTAIRLVSKKFGLDPAKDLVILQGGTQPSRLQALSVGALDATLVSPPLDLTAKKQGFSILVNIAELGIPYPQTIIETTERFNREHPQIVKSFLKGFIEGIYYAATHKDETKKIITKYLKTADPEILEATYQSFLRVTDYTAHPNLEGLRNAIDEVATRVSAAKNRRPEDYIDTKFLQELEKEGFFRQLQRKK